MNLAPKIADMFNSFAQQIMSTADRAISLRFPPKVAALLDPLLVPQRAVLREGACEGVEGHIACLTTNPDAFVDQLIGQPFALVLDVGWQNQRLFPMIVSDVTVTSTSTQGLSVVNIVGNDPMYFMRQCRRLRTFKDMPPSGVARQVLGEWTQSPLGPSFTFRFLSADSSRYPRRACFIQHPDQDDASFVERLLRAEGWSWYWAVKALPPFSKEVPQLELVIFDSSTLLPANPTPAMAYQTRDGVQEKETLELLARVYRLVPSGVKVNSWDHETGALASSSASADVGLGERGNALARALRSTRYAIDHLGDNNADRDRLANVQVEHYSFRARCLKGRGGVRTMAPGTWQVIDGYPAFAGQAPKDRTYTTVQVVHVAHNNLPAELHEAAQSLAGAPELPGWARIDGTAAGDATPGGQARYLYTNEFYCVPRDTPIRPAYLAERDEPRWRRLTGLVIAGRNGAEALCDEFGRVLVRLLGGEDGADTTVWVRAPVEWGGKNYGHVGILRADTEVDLEVLGPDRIAIVGVRYNARTPHPRFDHLSGLPNNLELSGIVSREMNAERQQQLRFNDETRNISVQLGTDESATQLNIGSLATPMNEGRTQPRGRGFELRTDAAGSIRSAEALLISTWQRLQAMGKVMDAQEHQDLLKDFADLFQGLGDYAGQHQGTAADVKPTTQLAADVKAGTAPTISLTAPAGVATTTPKTIMSYAGVNIDSVAMQHYQLTAGEKFLMNAGKGASLFVHQGDLRAIAHHGQLVMQSQHDDTQIDSAKDLKATAAKKMLFVAEEITWMTTGGAFVSLKGGKVTIGGSESLDVKTAGHNWGGPATMSGDLPKFSDGDMGRTPKILSPMDGAPVEGVQLHVGRAEGGDLTGQTDGAGKGSKVAASGIQRLKSLFYFRGS